jgi:predicted RNA-binding Zn ribbon-like protein
VPDKPPAIFVADSPALDFLNSVATPVDRVVDWLDSGESFVKWLAQANLVPAPALGAMSAKATSRDLDKVADKARALREWFRVFVRNHMGRPLTAAALGELKPLNALLQREETFSRITGGRESDRLELQTMRPWRSPGSLLLPIGEALARCVCDEDFADIKTCEAANCSLIFVDRTRRRARRWCSMAVCGNRAKQAAHRDRLKAIR